MALPESASNYTLRFHPAPRHAISFPLVSSPVTPPPDRTRQSAQHPVTLCNTVLRPSFRIAGQQDTILEKAGHFYGKAFFVNLILLASRTDDRQHLPQ